MLHLFLITLACYMLQNPHYDAKQYAASCYTKVLKSKYFTQSFILRITQFPVIPLMKYCVSWPHKTVNTIIFQLPCFI